MMKKNNFLQILILILIVSLLILLVIPTSEDIIHRREAGTYLMNSYAIESNGKLIFSDNFLKSLNNDEKEMLYENSSEGISIFPTYQYFTDKNSRVILPYLPFYPLEIALNRIILNSSTFVLSLNILFSIISIMLLFLIGKNIFNYKVGLIASSLLSINYLQIFFTKYHGPEILFQMIILSLMFLVCLINKNRNLIILIPIYFATLIILKLDSIFIIIGSLIFISLVGIYKKIDFGKIKYSMLLFLVLSLGIVAYFIQSQYTYLKTQIINTIYNSGTSLITLILYIFIILFFIFSLFLIKNKKELKNSLKDNWQNFLPIFLVSILVLMFLNRKRVYPWEDWSNLVSLSWYITVPGVILALLGCIYFIKKKNTLPGIYLLISFFITSTYLLHNLSNFPLHPWAMKRLIPFIIPTLLLFISNFIVSNKFIDSKRIIIPIIIFFMIIVSLSISIPIIGMKEFEGLSNFTENFSKNFDDNSIIIFYNDLYEYSISFPIKFIHKKNSILLEKEIDYVAETDRRVVIGNVLLISDEKKRKELIRFINRMNSEGREIYFINPDKELEDFLNEKNISLKFLRENKITYNFLELRFNDFSRNVIPSEYLIKTYKVEYTT